MAVDDSIDVATDTSDVDVVQHRINYVNVFLVQGARPILVDTAMPDATEEIVEFLEAEGCPPSELSLIVLTHGHADHAGSAREIRDRYGVPIMASKGDVGMLRRGRNGDLSPSGWMGKVLQRWVDMPFDPLEPDILVENQKKLHEWGVPGVVRTVGGHTQGSLTLELPSRQAIIGDLARGGWAAGWMFPGRPNWHYFIQDKERVQTILHELIQSGIKTFYVGHGGPLNSDDLSRALL